MELIIHALSDVRPETWEKSFKRVNLHPHHRVPFNDWLKRIDEAIQGGERFFCEGQNSLYEAMPALWKNMDVECRHRLVRVIDGFYRNTAGDPWNENNVKQLLQFAPLLELSKLRTCYLAAKKDPSVYVGS